MSSRDSTDTRVASSVSGHSILEKYQILHDKVEELLNLYNEDSSLLSYSLDLDDTLFELHFWYDTITDSGKIISFELERPQTSELMHSSLERATGAVEDAKSLLQSTSGVSGKRLSGGVEDALSISHSDLQDAVHSIADLVDVVVHYRRPIQENPDFLPRPSQPISSQDIIHEYGSPPAYSKEDPWSETTSDPRGVLPYGVLQFATDWATSPVDPADVMKPVLQPKLNAKLVELENPVSRLEWSMTLPAYRMQRPKFYWLLRPDMNMKPVPVDQPRSREDIELFVSVRHHVSADRKSITFAASCRTEDGHDELLAIKFQNDNQGQSDLKTEADILRGLTHSHIVATVGHGIERESDRAFVGLIYFPLAPSLDTYLERLSVHNAECQKTGVWTDISRRTDLIRYFPCLCRVVIYLHGQSRPITHRDIRPQNILLDRMGTIVLAGFSSAKVLRTREDPLHTGEKLTTFMYAPEGVASRMSQTLEWDVFSLGCVFLELATIIMGESLLSLRQHLAWGLIGTLEDVTTVRLYYAEALAQGCVRSWISRLTDVARHKQPPALMKAFSDDANEVEDFLDTVYTMLASAKERNALEYALNRFSRVYHRDCEHCHPDLLREGVSRPVELLLGSASSGSGRRQPNVLLSSGLPFETKDLQSERSDILSSKTMDNVSVARRSPTDRLD